MSYEEDVRFVRGVIHGGDWEIGLRIARNVQPGRERAEGRVSFRKFGADVGLSDRAVGWYYQAWEKAADSRKVKHAAKLKPTDEYDWEKKKLGKEQWDKYYSAGRYGENPTGSKRPPSNKEVVEAINTNPSVAKAARRAIQKKDREEAKIQKEADEKARAEFIAEAELDGIKAGGKVVTEKEFEEKEKENPSKLGVTKDALGTERKCIEAIENLEALSIQVADTVAAIVEYGSVPDSERTKKMVRDSITTISSAMWDLTSIAPESEKAEDSAP